MIGRVVSRVLVTLAGISVVAGTSMAAESFISERQIAANPVADPFGTPKPVILTPALPAFAPSANYAGDPEVPAPPAGLRTLLLRARGQGLLGTGVAGTTPIRVSHGQSTMINGNRYRVEVDQHEIRLYSEHKGKLLWAGALNSTSPPNPAADTTQVSYVPPLSAGVSPGLHIASIAAAGGSTNPINRSR